MDSLPVILGCLGHACSWNIKIWSLQTYSMYKCFSQILHRWQSHESTKINFLNQISHKTYLSKHHKNIAFTNMNLYITFLFQLFTATFTGLAIKWTNSIWFIKPGFFSNCSSHTSQDNNVLTKHNPSTQISFQTVHHILHKTTMYWPDTTLHEFKLEFFSKCSNNALTKHNSLNRISLQLIAKFTRVSGK